MLSLIASIKDLRSQLESDMAAHLDELKPDVPQIKQNDSQGNMLENLQQSLSQTQLGQAVGGFKDNVQEGVNNLEQAKIDMVADTFGGGGQAFYDAGFGNAEAVAHPQLNPLPGVDASIGMQNTLANAGISNSAASGLKSSPSMLGAPSIPSLQRPMPDRPPPQTSKSLEETRLALEAAEANLERKARLQEAIDGDLKAEELLLSANLKDEEEEEERASQIGAAAPIYLQQ